MSKISQSLSKSQQEKRKFIIFDSVNYVENKHLYDDVCCTKCYQVQPKMKQCEKCTKVYCTDCFDSGSLDKGCPTCGNKSEAHLPNQKLMTLSQMVFHCRYSSFGCATSLHVENLPSHEESCPFQNLTAQFGSLNLGGSSSTLAYSNSQSPSRSQHEGQLLQSQAVTIYRDSETQHDFVTMTEFKKLMNDVQVLKQICAANFKHTCNNGHPLQFHNSDSKSIDNVICDVCKRDPHEQNTGSYRCGTCDFDRCEQCFQQNKIF